MNYRNWLTSAIDELDRLYDHPNPHEGVWERAAAIATEAGDRAARLGLAEQFQASRQFGSMANPADAKAFLSACVRACTKPAASQYLDAAGACDYLGITRDSLYGLVERNHVVPLRGPRRSYRFTPAMLDEYLCRKSAS